MLRDITRSFIRITSFTGKELRETARRPGVLATLVLGPFLIMFLFGLGYTGAREPFATELVLPADADLPRDPEFYEEMAPGRIDVVTIGEDIEGAVERLHNREVALLIIAPSNPEGELREGRQTTVRVAWNETDPVRDSLAHLAVRIMVGSLNAEIIERAATEGIGFIEGEMAPEASRIPAEVIAQPTRADTQNVAPTPPSVTNFFAPAVFALVLQHLAVTLTALTMVHERLSGQMDLFRVSPLNSMELLVGKYVAYAALALAVSAIVVVLLVYGLNVPMLGAIPLFVGIVLLLAFASLGAGLVISLAADSERQAVQLSMLVLLASVFFSGFVLPTEDFIGPVRYLAFVLPVTHGIATLQDTMLRGVVGEPWMLGALLGIGLVLFMVALLQLRRILTSAD